MIAIIQARMTSFRLPGKMLKLIDNKPLLLHVINRVQKSKLIKKILVASSENKSDDVIKELCKNENVKSYHFSLDDVYERFTKIIAKEKITSFVRINGDSPLIDPELIDKSIKIFKSTNCDLCSNVMFKTYPKGQSVEVILSKTFLKLNNLKLSNFDKEHITNYYYSNPEQFKIVNFTSGFDFNNINLSVDTINDLRKIDLIYLKLKNKKKNWYNLVEAYKSLL